MLIAAVQFKPQFRDRKANLKALIALVEQAATAGAKVIVLPELATTGYSFMGKAEAEPYAEVLQYPQETPGSFTVFRALSRRLGAHIAWGLIEKSAATGNLFNSQVLVSPDGSFESYSKVNPFGNDFLWSTPGKASPPIKMITIDGVTYRAGLLVCRDVRDKSHKIDSFYEPGDTDMVLLSANWGKGAFPATAWMDFAKSNKTRLVVANRYGVEANNDFGEGGVCLIHRDGSVSCNGLVWGQDCIIYGNVERPAAFK